MPYFGQEIFIDANARDGLNSKAYQQIKRKLSQLADEQGLMKLFNNQRLDLLLAPCNGPAELIDPTLGDRSDSSGGWPSICSAAAVAGYPSMTVPALQVDGLPVGIALVAPRFQEINLLRAGLVFESAVKARRAPPRA